MLEAIVVGALKALWLLFVAGVVHVVYKLAKENIRRRAGSYLKAGALVIGIAVVAAALKGRPACVEYEDPMFGGCLDYDEGAMATIADRFTTFGYFLVLFGTPVFMGGRTAVKTRR